MLIVIFFLLGNLYVTAQKRIHYKPTWESLEKYDEAAEWFKDAKFGIFAHWGVLSVPAYANDWYPRNMHFEGSYENRYHVATYGPLDKFGYHDFVPLFTAEKFDANEWADLYVQAGAKFGGIVAEHHDGWSNWDSKINPWNSMDMGPHRDLVGELAKAIHSRGLKLVTTFHKERNLQLFQNQPEKWQIDTSYFPYNPKMATSSEDPVIRIMYGNIPKEQFYKNWLGELKELINNYSPDLIYFDGLLTKIPESYKKEFLAYYFNHSVAKKKQVVVTNKLGELPKTVSLQDFEKGRTSAITSDFWLSDESVSTGSWSYTNTLGIKTANEIIDLLADVVSKNGALLLNIAPMADGTIPQNQKDVLLSIGDWLKVNGEAIYGSRTWETFGEGPTKIGRTRNFIEAVSYTAEDVRYTRKGNTIYAIFLGWAGENKDITLQSFSNRILDVVPKVTKITLLANGKNIDFTVDANGLHFKSPQWLDPKAYVVKIETE